MTLTPDWCAANCEKIQNAFHDLIDIFAVPAGITHRLTASTEDGRSIATEIVVDNQCQADEVSDEKALMYMAACVVAGVKTPFILRTFDGDETIVRMWVFDGKDFTPLNADAAAGFLRGDAGEKTADAWEITLDY